MRILITGGAGFIGSHLADAYLQDGHEVAVLDNLRSGIQNHVSGDAKFYPFDICDASDVLRAFEDFRPDVVSHHAAQLDVTYSVAHPTEDAQINIGGSLNVLLAAVKCEAQRFIFASSGGAIYGDAQQLPTPESAPAKPQSPYGLTKLAFEEYLRIWHTLHGIVPVCLRYANVYGPRQGVSGEGGVVAVFGKRLLRDEPCTIFGDGTSQRDYIYVGDVVEANRAALSRGDSEVLNIGTSTRTTVREVFETVREAVGSTQEPQWSAPRAGEVYVSSLDASRASTLLGWKSQTTFLNGVQSTVEWIRASL